MNYYISDLHLGHANIIRFDKRPFKTVDEMDRKLIENWNNTVGKNDTVYVLGDMVWGIAPAWGKYLEQLKGDIVLITGNHDLKSFPANLKRYFQDIKPYKEIRDGDSHVIMSHYPIPFYRRGYDPNFWMLYGHVHMTREYEYTEGLRRTLKKSQQNDGDTCANFINVGCMTPWMDYTPRTLEQIVQREKDYWDLQSIIDRPW